MCFRCCARVHEAAGTVTSDSVDVPGHTAIPFLAFKHAIIVALQSFPLVLQLQTHIGTSGAPALMANISVPCVAPVAPLASELAEGEVDDDDGRRAFQTALSSRTLARGPRGR